MHIVIRGILVFFGLGILFLGLVFLIAGGTDNLEVGTVMVLVAIILFLMAFLSDRGMPAEGPGPSRWGRPVPPSPTKPMEAEKGLVCPYCGASVGEDDVKPKEGGLVLNCPSCHQVTQVEEGIRW